MSDWKYVADGEWWRVPAKGHMNACCDCGLVHVIDYRIAEDGVFEIRFRRDGRATTDERKRKKHKFVKGPTKKAPK